MDHNNYMRKALQLAKKGQGFTSPNPMVGCVIVKDDQIIAKAYHLKKGEAHAEATALNKLNGKASGATMYVTLEPCCHYGYTPPCVDAIIKSGIREVYIACLDPNPKMSGNSIKLLKAAGITTHVGLLQSQAEKLNRIFFHTIVNKKPYVIAKWAMSLDGKTTTSPVDSRVISNQRSHRSSHALRQMVDAIIVGANTARNDNPLLTIRNLQKTKKLIRIILSSDGNLPLSLNVFRHQEEAPTWLVTTDAISEKNYQAFLNKQIEVIILPKDIHNRVDLSSLMTELGKREISSVLVEGGMTIHESFFHENLVNEVQVFLAPWIIGNLSEKKPLNKIEYQALDNNLNIRCMT